MLLAVALVLAVRWRSYSLDVPAGGDEDSTPGGRAVRALTWRLCVGAYAGVLTGLFVAGPGGRLVMRLLAATSPEAQGRLTEAEAVVGDITVGGTVFFVVFMSIGAAGIGLLYVVLQPALPRGLFGGALFGAGLLVVFGSTIDPLRSDNPDFDIVGPGWLAIVAFTTLAIASGCFTAVAAARVGAAVPRPDSWSFSMIALPAVAVSLLLPLLSWQAALIVVAAGAVHLWFGVRPMTGPPSQERAQLWIRGLLLVAVVALLPEFLRSLSAIAT